MSQAAHTEGWPQTAKKPLGGRRFRFEVARSQLLILTAALALLAMLFFLSGLAVGLLMHPRWTPPTSQTQSEARGAVTAPTSPIRAPVQRAAWVSAGPPADETDLADIVWQPRRSPESWERSSVDASRSAQLPADPETLSAVAEPLAQVAEAQPVVDPVFETRPGGLAQPPRRWRQAQPLAAAYLTAPDDTTIPAVGDPTADSELDSEGAGEEPSSTPGRRPDPADPSDVDEQPVPHWTALQGPPPPSTPPEDTGWRPASSHWQSFYDGLLPAAPDQAPSDARTADMESASAEPSNAEQQDLFQDPGLLGRRMGEPSAEAAVVDSDALQNPGEEVDDAGWQPSSSLWQSFLDNPYDWSAERLPPEATTRRSSMPRGSMEVPYGDLMDRAARRHGMDVALVAAMVRVESDFDPQAVSHRGARGLMQVMPATAERFGVAADELFDPAVNLDVGLRYLSWLEDRFEGDTERMLAAYNAGEAAVDTYDGVPPYGETQRYVKRIYRLMGWAETQ